MYEYLYAELPALPPTPPEQESVAPRTGAFIELNYSDDDTVDHYLVTTEI